MSSHHIVREKQEPALYIHHFGNFNDEYLGQLLEWSPTVVVAGHQYEKAVSLGLKVDVVIGDIENLQVQENTKLIFSPIDKLETAVKYLIAEKFPAVNIISQEDKFDDLAHLLDDINIVLFTETQKSYPVKRNFSVWKPAGHIFKIDIISYFETANLKQKENGDFVVIKDGFVSFQFTTPYLFLSELLWILLRKAKEEDLPVIIDLAERIWPDTYRDYLGEEQLRYMLDLMYNKGELLSQLQNGHTFLVATIGDTDVGFASFSLTNPELHTYKLHKIYVLPSTHGQGVGKFLINEIINSVKRIGAKTLQLNVNRNNKAKDFYIKAGFEIKETVDLDIGNGFYMNDYVMEKQLNS